MSSYSQKSTLQLNSYIRNPEKYPYCSNAKGPFKKANHNCRRRGEEKLLNFKTIYKDEKQRVPKRNVGKVGETSTGPWGPGEEGGAGKKSFPRLLNPREVKKVGKIIGFTSNSPYFSSNIKHK